ncbi:uncharacterized protein IWZ02DRAFT_135665 [Phyllosticta citriasiana]|uniref:Uncharacterized protein n=1 Tax=Phyllosticta citriasiana TaxID=595635 RepID=A0ABR1KVQ0_9PEZI
MHLIWSLTDGSWKDNERGHDIFSCFTAGDGMSVAWTVAFTFCYSRKMMGRWERGLWDGAHRSWLLGSMVLIGVSRLLRTRGAGTTREGQMDELSSGSYVVYAPEALMMTLSRVWSTLWIEPWEPIVLGMVW